MISFQCPQCDKSLKARPDQAGARCKCTRCKAACLVPEKHGDPAKVALSQVKIRYRELPLGAAAVPPVCICCGRDAVAPALKVTVWSHHKSAGKRLAEDAAKAASYLLGGAVGFGVAGAFASSSEPFPIFSSVPTCGRCGPPETERLRLVAIEGTRLVIDGLASRFAVAVADQGEREAAAFEEGLLGLRDQGPTPPSSAGGGQEGFDWSSIQ